MVCGLHAGTPLILQDHVQSGQLCQLRDVQQGLHAGHVCLAAGLQDAGQDVGQLLVCQVGVQQGGVVGVRHSQQELVGVCEGLQDRRAEGDKASTAGTGAGAQ